MDKLRSVGSNRESQQTRRTLGNESQAYSTSYTTGQSAYTVKSPQTSTHETGFVLEAPINMNSSHNSQALPRETIKLMPVKIKDIMKVLNNNPKYRDKSPMIINMNENDIDQVIEQRRSENQSRSQRNSLRQSPISVIQSGYGNMSLRTQLASSSYKNNRLTPDERVSGYYSNKTQGSSKPPLGEQQAPQVYAMTDIQAYPMIGTTGFRANRSKVRRKKSKRPKSRMKLSPRRGRKKKRSRSRPRSRYRSQPRSRGRSRRPRSKPRRVKIRRPRRRSPVVMGNRPRYPLYDPYCCSPNPLCDNDYSIEPQIARKRGILQSRMSTSCNCNCTMCQEKLQFIQPSVCSKKRNFWTNEYAILPNNRVNLIDPCTELDPCVYPRADNPCIRDGGGNPLTDCIGRPLRDPVGKRFLNFSANGNVMEPNFRGNFYTGQPPVCVKCTTPGNTCAPDTTHNWWMNCGYPIRANMNPYFQRVFAAENRMYRR